MKYILIPIMFFASFSSLNAQVVISEVMYDIEGSDTGREWVEIENTGDSVDISTWKFFENGTNHGLTLIQGNATLSSSDVAIISDNPDKFLIDWPSFSGNLFDSSFSLKNTGELIAIRDADLNDIDSLTYDIELGAGEDGNSLQLILSVWSAALPTPGLANSGSGGGEESEQEEESSESSSSSSSSTNNFPVEQQIFADAGGDRNVVVGADTLFEGESLGLKMQPLDNARYTWNFGNGETKEGQNVLYYYGYPGEYVVTLSISSGQYSASDRIIVNAYPAELAVSKVQEDFVEIHNKSNRELNLSWWQLEAEGKRFMVPKDTIILSGKKLIFSSDVTGLNTHTNDASLLYPNGVEAVSFEQIKIPQKTVATKTITAQPIITKADPPQKEALKEPQENTIQTASVISSINNQDKESSMFKWLLAIFSIIVVSAGAIVFIGKSKKELSDEIEIID
ncbi:MAG: lamin tail domain-containing protein [Candidatus Pacebacteria bacterium]|nr:hypothetical protein [Parcubacteria group bacterium]MDP6249411.1 lamin tail domain-containing protein [Candidatus Paceibacterota bacterium]MDP7159607.1 lamin tail domain-containing protein [Candidatus Paceibacterota bacterium]MDP7466215.1 lamin tail domain-containing protein [Candidatus Paceibacterota bacterium]MDP7648515.1 lamin tail domain-containing protein [Candidatus Paceibacterota bacterium]|tara:strand:+ start:351 stop:1709 length:1359 start_codon:yes stop_codon:yes gene_type:complete